GRIRQEHLHRRRAEDTENLERCRPGVEDLVLLVAREDHRLVTPEGAHLAVDMHLALAGVAHDDLVAIVAVRWRCGARREGLSPEAQLLEPFGGAGPGGMRHAGDRGGFGTRLGSVARRYAMPALQSLLAFSETAKRGSFAAASREI